MNSKLLEEAIIDAEALREAALKNAEQVILEKYAPEVKLAIENLLEQEPPLPEEEDMMDAGMGMDQTMGMGDMQEPKEMNVPYGATDGFNLCPCPDDNEKLLVSVEDLRSEMERLVADLARSNSAGEELPPEEQMGMETEPEMPMDQEMPPEEPMDQLPPEEEEEELPEEPMMEEVELDENLLLSLLSEEDDKDEDDKDGEKDEKAKPGERPDYPDVDDDGNKEESMEDALKDKKQKEKQNESKSLNKAKMLVEKKNKLLTEAVNEIKQEYSKFLKEHKKLLEEREKTNNIVQQLSERLEETNLMNAKLFYKNQALGSDSLNERQKNKIVEAVSKAGSVDEAKMIYETLCNAVGSFDNRGPQSLGEAIEKRSNFSLKPRQQKNSNPNPIKNRWQKIAGIKK